MNIENKEGRGAEEDKGCSNNMITREHEKRWQGLGVVMEGEQREALD